MNVSVSVSENVNVSDYVNDHESAPCDDLYGYVNVRGDGHAHHHAEID